MVEVKPGGFDIQLYSYGPVPEETLIFKIEVSPLHIGAGAFNVILNGVPVVTTHESMAVHPLPPVTVK